jgi:hypothetical protein
LHQAMHQIPGVPEHCETPHGHQHHHPHRSHAEAHRRCNHGPGRPPRVLVGWQRRIGALFGQWV